VCTKVDCKEKLEELASYVVLCGGTRDLVNGWSAKHDASKQRWTYYSNERTKCFESRSAVARWLKLFGVPKLGRVTGQRTIENIASPEECEEALEKLVSYVVLCGGKRDLLEGWSTRRNTSKSWHYESKQGNRFQSRPEVARWLNLLGEPDVQSVNRLFQASKKRKR
jgi:hypothetical protein